MSFYLFLCILRVAFTKLKKYLKCNLVLPAWLVFLEKHFSGSLQCLQQPNQSIDPPEQDQESHHHIISDTIKKYIF